MRGRPHGGRQRHLMFPAEKILETRFLVITFPPDSVYRSSDFDAQASPGESQQAFPGLAERFESEEPGMHTTDRSITGSCWRDIRSSSSTTAM
jgi:hypothetical protein